MVNSKELDQGKRVVVGIRDTPVSESDPYSADMRKRMIEHRYEGEDVEAWIMPDIEAISYGRKVGYDLREADDIPPDWGWGGNMYLLCLHSPA